MLILCDYCKKKKKNCELRRKVFPCIGVEPPGKEERLSRENVCTVMVLLEKKKKKSHKHVTLMEQSVLHGSITCNSVFIQLPNAVNG